MPGVTDISSPTGRVGVDTGQPLRLTVVGRYCVHLRDFSLRTLCPACQDLEVRRVCTLLRAIEIGVFR